MIDVGRKGMFKNSPIPFCGSKKNFINGFIEVLDEFIRGDGEGWTIIDVFGGSGLLSHVAKHIKPSATVIYNDFDDYHLRIANSVIDDLNSILDKIRFILAEVPRGVRIPEEQREAIRQVIIDFVKGGGGDQSSYFIHLQLGFVLVQHS